MQKVAWFSFKKLHGTAVTEKDRVKLTLNISNTKILVP